MLEQAVGIAAGIFTSTSLLPQLVKMIREKKGNDISTGMLIVLLTGLALWTWYGIMKEDWPIVVTNTFSLLVNITIIILKWAYHRTDT